MSPTAAPPGVAARAATSLLAAGAQSTQPQQPVLLLDVMDTIVHDPFFEHMPRFFNMTFKELLASKHPTGTLAAWQQCSWYTTLCVPPISPAHHTHILSLCLLRASALPSATPQFSINLLLIAWVEFENDVIDEQQLFKKFFADGREFDGEALVQHMVRQHTLQLATVLSVVQQLKMGLIVPSSRI